MAPDRDFLLADERDSGGLALDEDQAERLSFVGFDDDGDATGFDDLDLVGFDVDAAAGPASRLRQALGGPSRGTLSGLWSAALALIRWQRLKLIQTHLGARRLRSAAVLAAAVLAATGIGLGLRSWLPARQPDRVVVTPAPPPAPSANSVLVAHRPIRRGEPLQFSDLRWQPWPPADIKQSYFRPGTRRLSDLGGAIARDRIAEGQPISAPDVVAPQGRGFMAAMLQPGMRAVSVAIGPETAASGLILPGDDVDVLLSMPVPALDASGKIAAEERASVELLLRNIRVLAIDQETDGEAYRSIVGHAATLEVTPKEAEIVTLANELAQRGGMLVLALRSIRSDSMRPGGAAAPSHMLDTEISNLLTDRPVDVPASRGLTIVRRAAASQL